MYLSRIAIDIKKHDAMKALYNKEKLHAMVESSFSGRRERRLWRLDTLAGTQYLLLLSQTPPDNSSLPQRIGYTDSAWETKSYDSFLSKITEGSRWSFRLTANPTVSTCNGDNARGKIKAVTVSAKQREWLKKISVKKGFLLQDDQFDVARSEWISFRKDGLEVRILSVDFEGILTVTDVNLFRKMLTEGIGREKAYGMGLLTVVPYV